MVYTAKKKKFIGNQISTDEFVFRCLKNHFTEEFDFADETILSAKK